MFEEGSRIVQPLLRADAESLEDGIRDADLRIAEADELLSLDAPLL